MKKVLLVLAAIILFNLNFSCNNSPKLSGEPIDVLSKKVYEEVQAKYSDLFDFEGGTAIVVKNNKYGLISQKEKEILTCEYDTILPLKRKVRILSKDKKFGVIDIDGKIIVNLKYDEINNRYKNYIPIKLNKKWGFFDLKGDQKIPFKYDEFGYMNDSVIILKLNDQYGAIDYKEKIIFNFKYDIIMYDQFGDKVSFLNSNNKFCIANSKNKIVTDCIYDSDAIPENGYVNLTKGKSSSYKTKLYGLVDVNTGKEVIPFVYEDLGIYSEGLIAAEKNGKYGFIDINNNTIIPFIYDDAEDFSEGLAMVSKKSGYAETIIGTLPVKKSGFINKKGEIIIPLKFDDSFLVTCKFKEGLAPMGIAINNIFANQFGYIDKKGNFVIKPSFESAELFENGLAEVVINDKIGFINKKGEYVIQCIYDRRGYDYGLGDSIILLTKDNIDYYFDYQGRKANKPNIDY